MTIESWNLVFSAVTSGLVLVGGIWLRYVVNQQLKSKDTTIETLNAAIKLQEHEISALKGDRAPAIAAEYKTMREHAERMTEEKQKLDDQNRLLTEQQKEKDKVSACVMEPADRAMSEAVGLVNAASIMLKHLQAPSETVADPYDVFGQAAFDGINEIHREAASRQLVVKKRSQELRERVKLLNQKAE